MIWYAYCLIRISVSCTWSQMQNSNWKQIRPFYYTWLHWLNNSYINSELDLCQRDCQCDIKCFFVLFFLENYVFSSHEVSRIHTTWGQPWHMHGISARSFFTNQREKKKKPFLSCSCRSTDTHSPPPTPWISKTSLPPTQHGVLIALEYHYIKHLTQPVTFQWKSTDLLLDG